MLLTPLHTRMISLRLTWGEDDSVVADGRIFDLRKRGIVPLGGKLQGPGVVHDMAVQLELAYPTLRIRRIQPSMSAFPFAGSPATRGEGCPDRLPNVQGLVGVSLQDGYGTALVNQVGGPRGCFHVFTLLRLLGPAIASVVDRERKRRGPTRATAAAGSPVFARSLIIDGMKGEGLHLVLRGMLFDLLYPPGANALPLEEELEESFEATADVEVEVPSMTITASAGRVRRCGPGMDVLGGWERIATVGALVGKTMQKGYTAQVQQLFALQEGLEPLQHLLFMLGPAMIQCMPSLVEELEMRPRRAESPHAAVDSCHMWRAGGPLLAMPMWRER
ncbi:MAG: DUF2889 domain-containing protein [Candidatus Binatia bacterium]